MLRRDVKRLSVLAVPWCLSLSAAAAAQHPTASPTQSNLDAGGLRPPEAIDPQQQGPADAPAEHTAQELARADREDAGRGLTYVWLNADVGGSHLGLHTFKDGGLVDPARVATTQTGLSYGGGLGARILNYTIGARFRMHHFSEWKLWTLGLEGQFRIPLGRLEPYVTVGAGYASLGSFSSEDASASAAKAQGFDARLGAGLDYYLTNTFSLGANLTGDVLVLSRSPVDGAAAEDVYSTDGSGVGVGGTLTAVVGLHF